MRIMNPDRTCGLLTPKQQQQQPEVPLMSPQSSNSKDTLKQQQQQQKQQQRRPINVVSAILGECLCEPFPVPSSVVGGAGAGEQFLELQGIQYIGLGAVVDELTPKERVYDTLEQLATRTERLISIGYLVNSNNNNNDNNSNNENQAMSSLPPTKKTQVIPLDIWNKTYPNDNKSMNKDAKRFISNIKDKKYKVAIKDLQGVLTRQQRFLQRGNNRYMIGITAHNLAVLYVLAGGQHDALALPLFQQAVQYKKQAFGSEHTEVAISLNELGIQYFANGQFDLALHAFCEARKIHVAIGSNHHHHHSANTTTTSSSSPASPSASPTPSTTSSSSSSSSSSSCTKLSLFGSTNLALILNNIACCNFQMGNIHAAVVDLQEARTWQHETHQQHYHDLDLLHVAITLSNCGYLKLNLKQYEEATACFEEALLIQQSVLGDDAHDHRAIRDTKSNLEFTNAFHS